MSFRQRSFLLRRGIFFLFQHGFSMFSIGRESSVAKSFFRMTLAKCHSDREVFYFDEESSFYFISILSFNSTFVLNPSENTQARFHLRFLLAFGYLVVKISSLLDLSSFEGEDLNFKLKLTAVLQTEVVILKHLRSNLNSFKS
jgi:hypothetical protein